MKILLIDPPFYRFMKYYNRFFPLGLTYLAAVLREQGHDVVIYDADANVDKAEEMDYTALEDKYPDYVRHINNPEHHLWCELKEVLNRTRPDLVGISIFTTKIAAAFRSAEIVKNFNPDIPVAAGGPHPSVKAEESLKIAPFIDFVVRGEGELSFTRLVDSLVNKKSCDDIPGISYRVNGTIHHNPDSDFIKDLDSIPFPARDMLINRGTYTSEDMGLIMSGRGCPFQCTFCSSSGIWHRVARQRSVENVIAEIKSIHDCFQTVQFSFKDDTFTLNKKRVLKFCRLAKGLDFKIGWDCNARVNLIDAALLKQMKSAGCNGIKVGIESGSERILNDVMRKNITLSQIKCAADLMRKAGLHWTGYFMMGLPSETKQDMLMTLSLMKNIRPDFASLSVFEPFPATELFDRACQMGYVTSSRSLNDYYSMSPEYYYFKDKSVRIDTMDDVEFRQMVKNIKKSFHIYNRGFIRIFKRVKARSSLYLKEPKMLLNDFSRFLAWRS